MTSRSGAAIGPGKGRPPSSVPDPRPTHKGMLTVTTILRRLLGVVLILAGLAALVVGVWFARSLGTNGAATFTMSPAAGMPVVIDAQTNARTDIPLRITATAADNTPITVSIAAPSDAEVLLDAMRYVRVTGITIRDWTLKTETTGTDEPIDLATVDLWRSQTSSVGTAEIAGDLERAPETMIITTPDGQPLTEVSMTWTNTAWFYQALSLVFAGLLSALVGVALILRRAPQADSASAASPANDVTTDSESSA